MKLKTIYSLGLLPAAMFIFGSCATEELFTDDLLTNSSLQLSASIAIDERGTRAGDADVTNPGTEAGEQEMNENVINTLDVFLYPQDADEMTEAVEHRFYKPGVQDTWTKKEAISVETLHKLMGDELLTGDNPSMCNVYVVANYYDGTFNAGSTTSKFTGTESRNAIRLTKRTSTFNQNVKQESFVMEGEALIPLSRSATGHYLLSGNISLYRVAAKVRLSIMIDPSLTTYDAPEPHGVEDANGNFWFPSTEGMKCMLVNGVKSGYISRELQQHGVNYNYLPQAADYFPTDMTNRLQEMNTYGRDLRTAGTDAEGHMWYKHDYPFYSYRTIDWKEQPEREAYILLMVPWTRRVGTSTATAYTFYQLPMPILSIEQDYMLRSYRYYRIEANIGSMGSFSVEDPVKVENNSYIVVNWGVIGTSFSADLDPVKYLAVYENNIVMEDTDVKEIQFASSDDLQVVTGTVSMRQRDLASTNYANVNPGNWTEFTLAKGATTTENGVSTTTWTANNNGKPITIKINNETGIITFEHDLKNEIARTGDFTEYLISFTVAHGGTDAIYRETINITQYPMLPVKRELNADYGTTNHNQNRGYVYVNGKKNTTTSNTDASHYGYNSQTYGGTHGQLNSSNQNPNRYIISVSSLTNDNYVIGDPRLKYVNNDLSGTGNITNESTGQKAWTAYAYNVRSAVDLDRWGYTQYETETYYAYDLYSTGYQNELEYYHPTEESTRTQKMLSPQFMVASSYGICTNGRTKEEARRRCASYQEDGYPAGRWRLPTQAEIDYVVHLSAWGKIPILFGYIQSSTSWGNDAPYWSANGVISVNSRSGNVQTTTSTSGVSVRCVYDTWYWDDKIPDAYKNRFYWGDKEDAAYWNAQ